MKVIQVVKRFGICGGMEEYAYRLSHELNKLSIHVSVVCERKINDPLNTNFPIHELGENRKKPRWWSHLQFAQKVRRWITDNDMSNTLIHSHERVDCHNITTIHSTLFNFPRKIALPSLRSFMNQRIERKEVLSQTVKAIVPVSEIISQQLRGKYPNCEKNLNAPICPGVSDLKIKDKAFDPEEPVIGFIGKEWKRKGLLKVIEIWRFLRKEVPKIRLCLAGFPENEDFEFKEDEQENIDILGYIKNKESFFEQIDLLLHPAKQEAYGMVIAEALSVGVPVICSSECGASYHVPQDNCLSLPFDRPTELWSKYIMETLGKYKGFQSKRFSRSWQNVAEDYLKVYQSVSS